MKKFILFSIILVSLGFVSCKKDKDEPAFTITGLWEGKLGTGTEAPDSYFALNLKGNGVVERVNGAGNVSATGTYQVTGDVIEGNYHFSSGTDVDFTATINKSQQKITGSWINDGNETGTFYLNKSAK
jgi:hypothetical protein